MSRSRITRLARSYAAATVLFAAGCTNSLAPQYTQDPRPTRAGPRDCGSGTSGLVVCVGEALDAALPDSVVIPLPIPSTDTTAVAMSSNLRKTADGRAQVAKAGTSGKQVLRIRPESGSVLPVSACGEGCTSLWSQTHRCS
jgi:hypothetical protein